MDDIKQIMRENGRDPEKRFGELMEEDTRSKGELLDDARHSAGAQIRTEMTRLYTTVEIVNKNHSELTRGRDWYQDQGQELWGVENRDELEAFQREYLRLLHNYSASVHSLIEHVYTLLDRYEDEKPELKDGYFDEIHERGLATKVDLVKQLRHYTQKRELPPVAATLHSERVDPDEDIHETEVKLVLQKDQMMDWDGWDSDVRDTLEEWDDEIDITDLATDFQRELNDFFDWFRMYILRIFYDEVEQHAVTMALLNQEVGSASQPPSTEEDS